MERNFHTTYPAQKKDSHVARSAPIIGRSSSNATLLHMKEHNFMISISLRFVIVPHRRASFSIQFKYNIKCLSIYLCACITTVRHCRARHCYILLSARVYIVRPYTHTHPNTPIHIIKYTQSVEGKLLLAATRSPACVLLCFPFFSITSHFFLVPNR